MGPIRFYIGLRSDHFTSDAGDMKPLPLDTPLFSRIRTSVSRVLAYMVLYWKAKIQGDFAAKCLLQASARESELQNVENDLTRPGGLVNDAQLRRARQIFLKSAFALEDSEDSSVSNVERKTIEQERFLEGIEWVVNEGRKDINTLARVLLGKQQADLTDENTAFIDSFYAKYDSRLHQSNDIVGLGQSFIIYRKAIANLSLSDAFYLKSDETKLAEARIQFLACLHLMSFDPDQPSH